MGILDQTVKEGREGTSERRRVGVGASRHFFFPLRIANAEIRTYIYIYRPCPKISDTPADKLV